MYRLHGEGERRGKSLFEGVAWLVQDECETFEAGWIRLRLGYLV